MDVLWFLPTSGDEHTLAGPPQTRRAADAGYLRTLATALDTLGYDGALLPTGLDCEDAWVTAALLAGVTQQLRFLVAVRPAVMLPAAAARMAATFDRLSRGRLLVNVVTGSGREALAADGVFGDYENRYANTDEFLTIYRSLLMGGKSTDFQGTYQRIENGGLPFAPVQKPYPPLYFGGSSIPALDVAARHADVYLTWGEPPAEVAEKIAAIRARAAAIPERTAPIRFGIRLHVVVRETNEAAWRAADDLLRYVDDAALARAQARMQTRDAEGQRRMQRLHGGRRDQLEVAPNLWAGIGLVRPGAGTALVGDGETVAARLREYAALGIDTFILSGYPHLEEAYRFAETVLPLLPRTPPAKGGTRVTL